MTDDPSVVGEACHIVAREVGGPPGLSPLTPEQRDLSGNLILLCNIHHKQVDDQVHEFTVARLHEIKNAHEKWVRETLAPDADRRRDDLVYLSYLEELERRVSLDHWNTWASWVFADSQPRIKTSVLDSLRDTPTWILSRVWPGRYPDLEHAFTDFRLVCRDFEIAFRHHAVPFGDEDLEIEKFYKSQWFEQAHYDMLFMQYEAHTALIQDLMLELTRVVNLLADQVRANILPAYRLKEGYCLVTAGPFMPDLSFKTYRARFREDERTHRYPGVLGFLDVRLARDFVFGRPEQNAILKEQGYLAGAI